jgi:RNA recognition motif-containing protein
MESFICILKGVFFMSTNLYVGNIPYNLQETALQEIFAPYGNVVSAKIISDRETGRSKGFGFVEMETADQAQSAIDALNETEIGGRNIRVNLARPKTDRRDSRF